MALPDILFKGVPRRYTRGFTAEVIRKTKPQRVVIPCAGAFALATTAVEAGIEPERIHCCDISLYTCTLGSYLADRPFQVRAVGRWEWLNQYMDTPIGQVAGVGLAVRLLQYENKRESLYKRERLRELTERQGVYIDQLLKTADLMYSRLGGLNFEPIDMWELMSRYVPTEQGGEPEGYDPENTLLLVNPPRYSSGYNRMYRGVDEAFAWDKPEVQQFDEDDYDALMDYLGQEGGPHAMMYYATPVKEPQDPADQWGHPWVSVFAARPKTGINTAINWVVSNRVTDKKLQREDVEKPARAKYKLFLEGKLTPESRLEVRKESYEVGTYYRDLFVHNLGMLNAEKYRVLLLDGKLLATLGLHLADMRGAGALSMQGVAKLRYAFSVDHPDYPKLHKLTLLSVLSSWFWDEEMSDIEPMALAVQTSMLTPHPEAKTARGLFKLKERHREGGQYKLVYYGDIQQRTAEETITEFLRRWG